MNKHRRTRPTFFIEGRTYSWRKIMTACSLVIYVAAQVGYLIVHHFDELPQSYAAINAGIFAFYFTKNLLFKNFRNGPPTGSQTTT